MAHESKWTVLGINMTVKTAERGSKWTAFQNFIQVFALRQFILYRQDRYRSRFPRTTLTIKSVLLKRPFNIVFDRPLSCLVVQFDANDRTFVVFLDRQLWPWLEVVEIALGFSEYCLKYLWLVQAAGANCYSFWCRSFSFVFSGCDFVIFLLKMKQMNVWL